MKQKEREGDGIWMVFIEHYEDESGRSDMDGEERRS